MLVYNRICHSEIVSELAFKMQSLSSLQECQHLPKAHNTSPKLVAEDNEVDYTDDSAKKKGAKTSLMSFNSVVKKCRTQTLI